MADTLQEHREPTLIRESYWLEYAREYASETVDPCNEGVPTRWPFNHIDWEEAAEELATDYDDVVLNGVTYKIRSS